MITVYSKNNCPYCVRAKSLLESKKVAYKEINIEEDLESKQFLLDQGLRSVPQIFDGTDLVPGGYQGLAGKKEDFWTLIKG